MAAMTANLSTHTAQALATHRWAELNTRDFAALDPARTVAVLPLGATEQHGPHLPLSVDTVLVDGVVNAALAHLTATDPVLVLPTQTLGLSTEHTAFAGTLHLSPQTLIQLWCDIGASVARAGVKKLLMFNAHGGNVGLMDVVARELRAQHGQLLTSAANQCLAFGGGGNRCITCRALWVVVLHVPTQLGAFAIAQHRVMLGTFLRGGGKIFRLSHVHTAGRQRQHHRGFNIACVNAKAMLIC